MCEKVPSLEHDPVLFNADIGNEYMQWDVFAVTLSGKESKSVVTNMLEPLSSVHGACVATVPERVRLCVATSLQSH